MYFKPHNLLAFVLVFCLSGCAKERSQDSVQGIRVVSLAPNITEMIFAVGGESTLAGRTSACDYPEAAKLIPVAGGFGAPSMEHLIQIRPDLVLDVALEDELTAKRIEGLGIKRHRIECKSLDDIPAALRQIGRLTGFADNAENAASDLEKAISQRRSSLPDISERPKVFVEIWGDPVMTAGRGSFLSDVIELAGGLNIGDEGGAEYYRVSSEWVIEKDPHVILCFYMAGEGGAGMRVRKRPGWQNVSAVRAGRIYDGFPNDVFLRPGPRIISEIKLLQDAIAGDGSK